MKLSSIAVALPLAVFANASGAVELMPRLGGQVGMYSLYGAGADSTSTVIGPSAGVTLSGDKAFADINFEALPVDVMRTPSTVNGWRTEYAFTLGVPVYESISLIAGYRASYYGNNFASSNLGDNIGPFVGVNISDLKLGETKRDVFSISVALQSNTHTDKSRNVKSESDVGANIRLGYRRSGSPHSFGIRYQVFGSSTFDEYVASLQYSYLFGKF